LSFEAFTESLLNHLESNFVLYAAELFGPFLQDRADIKRQLLTNIQKDNASSLRQQPTLNFVPQSIDF
jgi:hypothetical protein